MAPYRDTEAASALGDVPQRVEPPAASCLGPTSGQASDEVVVVVGAGVAGLTAAWAVVEAGGRAVVLEKRSRCGGSAVPHFGVPTTERGGRTVPDVDLHVWLASLGLAARQIGTPAPLWAAEVVDRLVAALQRSDRARIVMGARVRDLLAGFAGECVGCTYVSAGGEVTEQRGSVILCAGGFGADFSEESLIARYRPDLLHLPTACAELAVGDGLRLAASLGVQKVDLERVRLTPLGLTRWDMEQHAKARPAAPEALLRLGGAVLLDGRGKRFCDELRDSPDNIVAAMWRGEGPFRLVVPETAAAAVALGLCEQYIRRGLARRHLGLGSLAAEVNVPVARLAAELGYQPSASGALPALPAPSTSEVLVGPLVVFLVVPVVRCCVGGVAVETRTGAALGSEGRPVRGLFVAGEAAAEGLSLDAMVHGEATCDSEVAALFYCLEASCVAGRAAVAARAGELLPAATAAAALAAACAGGGGLEPVEEALADAGFRLCGRGDQRTRAALELADQAVGQALTAASLQAALAEAHVHGGSLDDAAAALLAALLPGKSWSTTAGACGPAQAKLVCKPQRAFRFALRDRGAALGGGAILPTPESRALLSGPGAQADLRLSCVHCRLPATLEVRQAELRPGPRVVPAAARGRFAYATLLYGGKVEYFLGALVTGWSLQSSGCKFDRLLLHTDDVPSILLRILERFWTLRLVDYLEGCSSLYKDYSGSRFKAVFTKLQALSCTDYGKLLMLDLDMLVRGNLDELFDLAAPGAMKRSSGREQPPHGGKFSAEDLWRPARDDMCSGINAGVMLLEPNEAVYKRMVAEIQDPNHPEHLGTYGPEQDYLSRFYCVFMGGAWSHIHARFNYQLLLPDDYVSSAHRALRLASDVVVAHYSGPRVKPWELERGVPLDTAGVQRLLTDDSVRDLFGGGRPQQQRRGPPRERIMDGVLVVEKDTSSELPEDVRGVMFEWVLALRACVAESKGGDAGEDILAAIAEVCG